MAGRVLITGSSGLIGRHVMSVWDDALDGETPIVLDRRDDDLLDPGTIERVIDRVQPKSVLHLAWCGSGTPSYRSSLENRGWVRATRELAACCRDRGIVFYGVGTVLDVGTSALADEYTVAKAEVRTELEPLITDHRIGWFRPFYVFDPTLGRPALVADSLQALRAGRAVRLRAPNARHDFVHVADVARAMVMSLRCGSLGELPIGTGTLRAVHKLVEALGADWVDVNGIPVGNHGSAAADTTRLAQLGWKPERTEEFFAHV